MGNGPARNRPWWRDVATVVAVVGLLGTLVFNTLGVRQQVDQSRLAAKQAAQTRIDTQLGLLTQLNGLVDDSDKAINETGALAFRCRPWAHDLSRRENAAIVAAAQYYDYLAWLFNQRHITMGAAKQYWLRSMLDAYDLISAFNDPGYVRKRFRQLALISRSAPPASRPRPCR